MWMVIRGGWRSCGGSDFNVVARCLLFFYKIDISHLPKLIFQHAPVLPIFDVRCVHRPNTIYYASK